MRKSLKTPDKDWKFSEGFIFAFLFCSTLWCIVGTIIFQLLIK